MKIASAILFLCSFFTFVWAQENPVARQESPAAGLSQETRKKVQSAMDRGVRFLRQTQNDKGHWDDPGITALILTAFFRSHRKYGPEDGPWVRQPLEFLVSCQKPDGGIYNDQLANYVTCVAVMALTSHPDVAKKYRELIDKAKNFIIQLQCDEGEQYNPKDDKFYGGFGYGSSERPDLSNTQFALETLREAGVPEDHPVFKKALVFLQRCQNRSESNEMEWAGNDGGFVYLPGESYAGKETVAGKLRLRSYGSMTYAGIKSYIYANLKKDDPRVQSAYNWIRENYDMAQNPGMGLQGLFYYYHIVGKTLSLLGEPSIVDKNGQAHNWKEDLAQVLLGKQQSDGFWKNTDPRWWEAEPRLVTAYAIIALAYCLE
jgi:squalene-hopene/tetraprenyl-beta-curcumene cyclase